MLVYPVGSTKACSHASEILRNNGIPLVDHPTPEVTHLLLDTPSFESDGRLRGGGTIHKLLEMLPPEITVIGGNLNHPALEGYQKWDLLKDAFYLAQNAAITADCALRVAVPLLETTFSDSPALIIGWGRIGKCLANLLKGLGCQVTIASRKEADRAMQTALGFRAVDISKIPGMLDKFRLLFNTAPEMVVPKAPPKGCVAIDLASQKGIAGENVIWSRGLPGRITPESSGKLMAQCIAKYIKEGF